MTSAPSRCSARANDVIVRVLCSKNMFTHGTPSNKRGGRSRSNSSVRAKMYSISSAVKSSRSIRLRLVRNNRNLVRLGGLRANAHDDALPPACWNEATDIVRLDRQLAKPAIDEHAKPHGSRAAEVGHRVERGAHRSSRVQHVIDDDYCFTGEIARNL